MYTRTQRVSNRGQMGHFTPQPGPNSPSLHWELRNSNSNTGRKQKRGRSGEGEQTTSTGAYAGWVGTCKTLSYLEEGQCRRSIPSIGRTWKVFSWLAGPCRTDRGHWLTAHVVHVFARPKVPFTMCRVLIKSPTFTRWHYNRSSLQVLTCGLIMWLCCIYLSFSHPRKDSKTI